MDPLIKPGVRYLGSKVFKPVSLEEYNSAQERNDTYFQINKLIKLIQRVYKTVGVIERGMCRIMNIISFMF